MAKRRMISQELIYDEDFNSLSLEAQCVFLRMLSISDDCGVVPANLYTLKTLINVPEKIAETLNSILKEICNKKMGFLFDYNDKQFFAFKLKSFENYQSYILKKATKSEYLKISKREYAELSKTFQEIPINYLHDDESALSTVESIKHKVESTKQKAESIPAHQMQSDSMVDMHIYGGELQNFRMQKHADIQELFRQWNIFAEKYGLAKIKTEIAIPNFRLLIVYSLLTDPDFDLKTTPSKVFSGIIKKSGDFYLGKDKNKFKVDFDFVFREKKWISFLEANSIANTNTKLATSKETYCCPACSEDIKLTDNQGHRYSCSNQKYWNDKDAQEARKYYTSTENDTKNNLEFQCNVCGYINVALRPFLENRPKAKTTCKKCNKEFLNEDILNNKQSKTQGVINNVN